MGIRELRDRYQGLFDEFFQSYPRHIERQDAFAAFIELGEDGVDLQEVVVQARSYARNVDPDQLRYVPSPKSWLRGRRWEDEDLFTDRRVSAREWFVRAYKEADAASVERRYGYVYPDPPIPADVQDIQAWCRDDRKRWIGAVANHVLNGTPLPD